MAAGITINGLPILDVEAGLDEYYAAAVVGGLRAFVTVACDAASFPQILLRKLVAELAATPTGAGPG